MTDATTPPFIAEMLRITSFVEADEILRSSDFSTGEFEEESLPFRGRTVLELNGEEHRARRKTERPLFERTMLDWQMREILEPAIERNLKEADEGRGPDGVVRADLTQLSHRMFLQVAAAFIGLDDIETPERTELLERCMYKLNAAFDVKYATRDHSEVVVEGLDAKKDFIEHFYGPSVKRRAELLVRHKRGDLSDEELPRDLLTLMLQHHQADWDADLPTREAILYMAGATNTTSNGVNHAVAEMDRWLADHPGDRERRRDAAFLRGVCNEALRLHQNVTALARRANVDVTLSTGRDIPAGRIVALDFVQANKDPDVFGSDAENFNPWRPPPAAGARPYGLAFGMGRHLCIGLPLVTPITGKATDEGVEERALSRIVRALVDSGVKLDPERPPKYTPTEEDVYEALPVLLTAR